jgi:hypothetical protein
MVDLLSQTVWRLVVSLFISSLAAISASAQTPMELRARYGEPQMRQLKNNHLVVERYLVRPNILMTIKYTKQGRACEALIEPVPLSTPATGRGEHAPEGDYMSTAEVIKIIDELVPVEQRGKKVGEGSMNGGDPEMRLHHPGCWGAYFADYENVTITCSTWCWGGTFSATIHWGKTICRGQSITIKDKRPPASTDGPPR